MKLSDRRPGLRDADALEKQGVEALIGTLSDGERPPGQRARAADALGKIGDPRAVEPLIAALQGNDFPVREHAIDALGKIGDPRAVEPLIAKLKDRDEDFYLRKKAARTLYIICKQGRLDEELKKKVLSHWHSWYLL